MELVCEFNGEIVKETKRFEGVKGTVSWTEPYQLHPLVVQQTLV
jgi:hypothetical protein